MLNLTSKLFNLINLDNPNPEYLAPISLILFFNILICIKIKLFHQKYYIFYVKMSFKIFKIIN